MPSRRRVLASLGLLATSGCLGDDAPSPPPAGRTDWPHPDFNAGATSYNPNPVGPRSGADERWRRQVPQPTGRPVVADGRVFLPTLGGVRTFAVDGDEGWSLSPLADRSTAWMTSPAVHDGVAYLGTDDARSLLAVDAADGTEIWRTDVGDVSVAPVPDHDWGSLFVGTRDGSVARVDADSGAVRWSASVFGAVTSLATSADLVYAGTEAGEVYALFDGQGQWRRKLPGSVVGLALGNGGPVYATTFGGGTFELADGLHAGATRWHDEDGTAKDSLVVTDDTVYGADGGGLTATSRHGGDRQWSTEGSFTAGMAGAGETLYIGEEDGVSAYRMGGGVGVDDWRVGARRWRTAVGGPVVRGLAVAAGSVFVPVGGDSDAEAAFVALG
ncbi:PQQ-binding-like beta-propeller repeat protein [Haloplanus halobius]|uniref:outer membrane protein assembly factor BamB family protein n=1 Tax=Haloplanus halobius TaxID=2934938 RepID=UPI00200F227D|nr:PQQ-binding-like beta-propeller repeat protein [Haloplanus sp. XH21]